MGDLSSATEGAGEGEVLPLVAGARACLAVQTLRSRRSPEELESKEDLSVFDEERHVVGAHLEDGRRPRAGGLRRWRSSDQPKPLSKNPA